MILDGMLPNEIADFEKRFWAKVRIPRDPRQCWIWTAAKNDSGYGQIRVTIKGKTSAQYAARLVYEMFHGELGPKEVIRHYECGNGHGGCVNPHHLLKGTYKQNAHDRIKDGTDLRGEQIKSAKLTEEDVEEIRRLVGGGALQKDMAAKYSVSKSRISEVVHYNSWKHVP